MKVFEYSARTIQEAIDQGLEELGVAISDVTVDVLEEGSKGLFGLFGSRPAKVRITMKDEADSDDVARSILADAMKMDEPKARKQEKPQAEKPAAEKEEKADKSAPKPRKPREPKAPKDDGVKAEAVEEAPKKESKPRAPRAPKAPKAPKEPVEQKEIVPAEQADRATAAGRAQDFLQEVTKLMGVNVSVAVKNDEEGNVRVNMEGDTLGILIGRRGETLDALQYLTSLQVNKGQDDYTRVTLDTEGYRAKREEALVRLANRMANRAQKTGRKVSLEPMNPYERRILHSALQDHPAVTTHSEGEEPNRHVVITLK